MEQRISFLYVGTVVHLFLLPLHAGTLSQTPTNDNSGHFLNSPLQAVRLTDLPKLLTKSCVLLGIPPYPSDLDIESLLLELSHVFQDDKRAFIGQFSDNATDNTNQIQWKKTPKDEVYIAFYSKETIDRTCLLSPPQTTFSAYPYTGQMNVNVLVQFINEKCHTFRTPHGSLTPEGLFHQHLMENLYIPDKPTQNCAELNQMPSRSEFFTEYLLRSRPVIIRNAYKDSLPIKKWTQQYLRELFGHKHIHIKLTNDGIFEGVESGMLWEDYHENFIPPNVKSQLEFPDLVVVRPATSEMLFSDFLDLISSGNASYSAYLEYSSIPAHMPEVESDVTELPFIARQLERRQLNMWLSDGNTLGKLHFDPYDNFLCMLSGEKHLTLFDPHHNENLYEAHIPEAILSFNPLSKIFTRKFLLKSTSMVMSPVDILEPDLERFPNFVDAHRVECVLRHGDVLFMPAFWWHEVQSFPDTVEKRNLAINFWYEPLFTKEFPCPKCRLNYNMFYKHFLHDQSGFD